MRPIYLLVAVTTCSHSVQVGGRLAVMLYAVHLSASPATVGLLAALFNLVNVVTSVRVGRWIDKSGSRVPMLVGSVMITLSSAGIGMGLGLTGPISQALLHDLAPPERIGELLGLRVTPINVSHAGVPILSGAIGAAIGVGPVFWVVAGCLFAGSWMTRGQWHQNNK